MNCMREFRYVVLLVHNVKSNHGRQAKIATLVAQHLDAVALAKQPLEKIRTVCNEVRVSHGLYHTLAEGRTIGRGGVPHLTAVRRPLGDARHAEDTSPQQDLALQGQLNCPRSCRRLWRISHLGDEIIALAEYFDLSSSERREVFKRLLDPPEEDELFEVL